MKMKMSEIIRRCTDENMAQIIGAVIVMQTEGLTAEKAMKLEYPNTLKTLQQEMEIDYKPTNADRIRTMSDEELADFLIKQEEDAVKGEVWEYPTVCLKWLQSEVEE